MRNCSSLLVLLFFAAGCRSERTAFYFPPSAAARPLPALAPAAETPAATTAQRTAPAALQSGSRQLRRLPGQRSAARRPVATRGLQLHSPGHSETARQASPYGKARRQPLRPARDYTPLIMAAILVALGSILLIGAAATLTSSFIPLIGILLILLGGVVYFHWRYE